MKNEYFKLTKGNKKLLNYFSKLIRNKQFLAYLNLYFSNDITEQRSSRIARFIAKKYCISQDLLYDVRRYQLDGVLDFWQGEPDVCGVQSASMYLDRMFQSYTDQEAYPVVIKLHKLITKNELLDFIEKRWSLIDWSLRLTGGKSLSSIKQKKNQEIRDFVYETYLENKGSKGFLKIVEKEVRKKFPQCKLRYCDINTIVYEERKERKNELGLNTTSRTFQKDCD